MRIHNLWLLVLLAAIGASLVILISCGSGGDDDDDTTGDDSGPYTCEEAMGFLFDPDDGCFQLTDAEGNAITPEELCSGDYQENVDCYMQCHEENDSCVPMGVCLDQNCGVNFNQ